MPSINFNKTPNNILPDNNNFFKEEILSQIYILNSNFDDISDLIDFFGSVDVEDYVLKNEEVGLSTEGKYMSGKKIIATVRLKGKLSYNTNNINSEVRVLFFDLIKNIPVVIPETFKDEYTSDLIRAKRFSVKVYMEDLYCRKIDERRIHILSMLFVDVKFF